MGNSDSRALAKATKDLKDAGAPADILKSNLRTLVVSLGTCARTLTFQNFKRQRPCQCCLSRIKGGYAGRFSVDHRPGLPGSVETIASKVRPRISLSHVQSLFFSQIPSLSPHTPFVCHTYPLPCVLRRARKRTLHSNKPRMILASSCRV